MKICRKYLVHVQKSVFEGFLTEKKLEHLKSEIDNVIQAETDAVCIYRLDTVKFTEKYQIGRLEAHDSII